VPGTCFTDLMAEAQRSPALGELIGADDVQHRQPA
jgi:hypothetical protein